MAVRPNLRESIQLLKCCRYVDGGFRGRRRHRPRRRATHSALRRRGRNHKPFRDRRRTTLAQRPHAVSTVSMGEMPDVHARLGEKDTLDHVRQYFAIHAAQRMTTFNFFLVLAGFILAGLAACLRDPATMRWAGTLLGSLLTVVSFIFWKLDERVAFLLKHAEKALAEVEERHLEFEGARLFCNEPECTKRAASTGFWPWRIVTHQQHRDEMSKRDCEPSFVTEVG
jgi:hypothetical protein